MDTLLDLAEEHEPSIHGPLLCAFHTGMRQSELFGLQWRDIDFAHHRIQVLRSFVNGEYKVPKSVQAILGHHSAAFTLEIYAHVLDEDLGEVGFLNQAGKMRA